MKLSRSQDGFVARFEQRELHIHSDESQGFRPYQLLISSIAGCSGIIFKQILDKMRLPYDDFTIETEVQRNPEKANRVERVHMHYVISGSELNEAKIQRALHLARENCPIVQSVQDSIVVTESYELV